MIVTVTPLLRHWTAALSTPMRDFIVGQGVPSQLVQVENESVSTRQSAVYFAAILRGDPSRKVLLTFDFHMGRAREVISEGRNRNHPTADPGRLQASSKLGGSLPSSRYCALTVAAR
jgi:hypothetical protein